MVSVLVRSLSRTEYSASEQKKMPIDHDPFLLHVSWYKCLILHPLMANQSSLEPFYSALFSAGP